MSITWSEDLYRSFRTSVAGDVRDPYPVLGRWRRERPVLPRNMMGVMATGAPPDPEEWGSDDGFTVFRHDDVVRVLRSNDEFSCAAYDDLIGPTMGVIMLSMDPPVHTAHRAVVESFFRQRTMARFAETIRAIADQLVADLVVRGEGDLVTSFCRQLPTRTIASLLGLPAEKHEEFHSWSTQLLSLGAYPEVGRTARQSLENYISIEMDSRRRAPRGDLLSHIANFERDGRHLPDDEVYALVTMLLVGGIETTDRALGNMLCAVLSRPALVKALRDDPALVKSVVNESLRWESPVLFFVRRTRQPVVLSGTRIPAGVTVAACIGSAKRDDEYFPSPDSFELGRSQKQVSIAFGVGPHVCLGIHLARLEMQVGLDALLAGTAALGFHEEEQDPHIHGLVFRSPERLHVRLTGIEEA
jgi:cytochrome P450